jgi:alanine dehydrogenase
MPGAAAHIHLRADERHAPVRDRYRVEGPETAIRDDPLALGVNAHRGHVTNAGVAEAHGLHTRIRLAVDGLT